MTYANVIGDAKCECSDPRCPVHNGRSQCEAVSAGNVLYRIDMEDETGTVFCDDCAEDTLESGLFWDGKDEDEDDTETHTNAGGYDSLGAIPRG